jgi:hypothetical protein
VNQLGVLDREATVFISGDPSRLLISSRLLFIIMRHLQSRPLKPTFDIKPFIRLTTIQDALITPDSLGHGIQGLNNSQPKFLSLLIFGNSDILDVPYKTHVVDEFPLDDHGAGADDGGGGVEDDEDVVGIVTGGDEVIARVEFRFGGFANSRQDAEGGEEVYKNMGQYVKDN